MKIYDLFVGIVCIIAVSGGVAFAAPGDKLSSCGAGYILGTHTKLDGIKTDECQKLWCRDLETGRVMGTGKSAATGYQNTNSPRELCDAEGNCIECFGDRKWCAGDVAGVWNPEYGAYTRGGVDDATYTSYQKGGCFSWRLEKPNCSVGETAILRDGRWVCAATVDVNAGGRAPAIRRTGITHRLIR